MVKYFLDKQIDVFRPYSTLFNPKQAEKVNWNISNIESISHGLLQGSCLGPLLFIHINDLCIRLKNVFIFSKIIYYFTSTRILSCSNPAYSKTLYFQFQQLSRHTISRHYSSSSPGNSFFCYSFDFVDLPIAHTHHG